jgi:hypothetical protein
MGGSAQPWMQKEIMQMLPLYPLLGARVNDLALNEEYRPSFPTDWCKPAHPSQSDQGIHGGYATDISGFASASGGTTSMQNNGVRAQY